MGNTVQEEDDRREGNDSTHGQTRTKSEKVLDTPERPPSEVVGVISNELVNAIFDANDSPVRWTSSSFGTVSWWYSIECYSSDAGDTCGVPTIGRTTGVHA